MNLRRARHSSLEDRGEKDRDACSSEIQTSATHYVAEYCGNGRALYIAYVSAELSGTRGEWRRLPGSIFSDQRHS